MAKNWERINDSWTHCGRPAWIEDEGAVCSKCQNVLPWDDEPNDGMENDR